MSKKKKTTKASPSKELVNVDDILAYVRKVHGEGSITCYKDGVNQNVAVVSSGSLLIDAGSGVGGFPKGRIIEIYGHESSGKTTICLSLVAEAQKQNGMCAFIDTEHALDPHYASSLGVNMKELLISQPDCGEDAMSIAETLILSKRISVLIIDSVAALVPRAEIEGNMGDSHVGLQARLMSQALRKLTGIIQKSNTVVVFTNQLREKIGVMYGNPETTTGGKALKFYASMRLEVRKVLTGDSTGSKVTTGKADDNKEAVFNTIRVKFVKNKVAPPFTVVQTDIYFGRGFDFHAELFQLALKKNLITKSGGWYKYDGETIAQGSHQTIEYLRENNEFANQLYEFIKDMDLYDELDEDEDEELVELRNKLDSLTTTQISLVEKIDNTKDKSVIKKSKKKLSVIEKKISKLEKKIEAYG